MNHYTILRWLLVVSVVGGILWSTQTGHTAPTPTTTEPPSTATEPPSTTTRLHTSSFSPLQGVTAIAAGSWHTCALTGSGEVWCWGYNWSGQLGDGSYTDRSTPVAVSGLPSGVTAIAAGGAHTCALTSSGGVMCWGGNYFGQLGDGSYTDRSTPVAVSGLPSGVTAIAAGGAHTCALMSSGGVWCWGYNLSGQLGDGSTIYHITPVAVSGLPSEVTAIAAGYAHTCALTGSGGVWCWGDNGFGQLGDGSFTDSSTPAAVGGLPSGVTAIAAGGRYTCALTSSGGVWCWGRNDSGQLGDGSFTNRSTPGAVGGLPSGVTAIAAGGAHTCALTSSGGVWCWGGNDSGQLGDGSYTDRSTPGAVSGLPSGVTAIAAGGAHTCARTSSGGVWCWGGNFYGQLGDGTTTDRSTPGAVSGLPSGVTAIAAGNYHTCALTGSDGVWCWGDNFYGQLGDGTTTNRSTPGAVSGLPSGVTAIAAGNYHTCALTSSGGVWCWGRNDSGQLGDGTTTNRSTPGAVGGLPSGVTAIAAGDYHTCALMSSGGVWCWGLNNRGQLGDGSYTDSSTPVAVGGLPSGVMAIAAGNYHTCALTGSDGVWCWGTNSDGQLGDGTTTNRSTPVAVSGLPSGVTAIAAGNYHTCALTSSGGVWCWGYNLSGQLGDGTTTNRSTPGAVSGLPSGVTAIAAGDEHTCALTGSGGVWCWGDNYYGQLGDGTTTNRSTPGAVSGLPSGVTAIAAGVYHTCALTGSGGVMCWGNNGDGQLGDGRPLYRTTPVDVVTSASWGVYLPMIVR
ncbi:RCC1 domain-containing protein [Chloroflexus aggregans]|uniref:Regulator of chromosome condensation RCC1 n=1 Tax=Chloroflexus aggregans (strain MD-66 / DSM 9485) TaxID=326427 RepID=B8G4X0_CHLAD|nr:chromosome condensation regulator RCC1 [Chloroflexus aggregans]ACL23603.1 regulator of chromosome condensation RCC1 [Chloroflexus aggregans DSM 9485]